MKLLAGFAVFVLVLGCGKVGEPLPPFIRIPEAVKDLAVSQSGYTLVLSWTNPARNIDGSAAADLSRVEILSANSIVADLPVTAPAEIQTHSIPLAGADGRERTFALQVVTSGGKLSNLSNAVSVTPVEVPGRVSLLRAVVDQRRIFVEWERPAERPDLVNGYRITRSDRPMELPLLTESRYEDTQYEPGKTITYSVTAVREIAGGAIPGIGPESVTVQILDKKAPAIPAGLDIFQTGGGAFLTWTANDETDLAGYHVFRSDRADGEYAMITNPLIIQNSYFDPSGRSGLYYAVSAVDEFDNESGRSASVRVP